MINAPKCRKNMEEFVFTTLKNSEINHKHHNLQIKVTKLLTRKYFDVLGRFRTFWVVLDCFASHILWNSFYHSILSFYHKNCDCNFSIRLVLTGIDLVLLRQEEQYWVEHEYAMKPR